MENRTIKKSLVIGILFLFIGAGFSPIIGSSFNSKEDVSSLTFYIFGRTGTNKCEVDLPSEVVEDISFIFEDLKNKLTSDPTSDSTQKLKVDFIDLLDVNGLIPVGLSRDDVFSLLNPSWLNWINGNSPFNKHGFFSSLGSRINSGFAPGSSSYTGIAFLCSIAGAGSGLLFPPLMIPRPRFVKSWAAYGGGLTTAANLLTGRGFTAFGPQFGITLGFMGLGLTWAIPGEPAYFAFGGYALFTMVGAAEVETYPQNRAPVISEENPSDGSVDVPLSLSELSFRIADLDGDRMSYSVTTDPDIGSGSGSNVVGGVYSIPVSGLNSNSMYSWHVVASDAEDASEETFSFRTADEAPRISDPLPVDGDDWVSVNISELSFRLEDFQGDLMDFSVETVPDIGSGSGTGVGNGVYSVDVSGLEYTQDYSWFVNVTDGKFWARRVFNFRTQPMMVFNPFEEGWSYRKKITINHSMVDGNLSNFPVLVSLVDSDLTVKAQVDGDDVLFMDGSGIASRLYHEIERYDASSDELVAWVNVPSLSSVDDTVLYLYYGNPDCSNQEFPENVWDSNFCGVWHLDNFQDSTINGNDGTNHGTDDASGKIGMGRGFVETNHDYISLGDMPEPADGSISTATFEGWVNPEEIGDIITIVSKFDTNVEPDKKSYHFRVKPSGQIGFSAQSGTWYPEGKVIHFITIDNIVFTGNWQYIVAVVDLSSSKGSAVLYYNGEPQSIEIETFGTPPSHFYNINLDEKMGQVANENGKHYFDGLMDEIRISKVERSEVWISTQYNNQNDPLSFYSVGSEESSP